jgi:hypothetical protein
VEKISLLRPQNTTSQTIARHKLRNRHKNKAHTKYWWQPQAPGKMC